MKIPLHCLVLDFTEKMLLNEFHKTLSSNLYNIISTANISKEIFGSEEGYYIAHTVFSESKHRVFNKLWHGERVIYSDAHLLKKSERLEITNIAIELGIQVFYHFKEFPANDKDLSKGDNVAQIIVGQAEYLEKIEPYVAHKFISKNFAGISVVGDVHGHLENMMGVLGWTKMRNNIPIFLGDLLDFGPQGLECIEEVYKLVIRNQAIFIIGNHERKIFKWLNKLKNKNIKIHLSEANKQTIEQIKKLSISEKKKWEVKFRTLFNLSYTHLYIENLFFAHASYCALMDLYVKTKVLPFKLEKKAMFGEIVNNPNWDEGNNSSYTWVDEIPKDMTVFVGHDPRNMFKPLHVVNEQNGEVYFMDTGCGKGGFLSTADLKLENNNYILTNFNSW